MCDENPGRKRPTTILGRATEAVAVWLYVWGNSLFARC